MDKQVAIFIIFSIIALLSTVLLLYIHRRGNWRSRRDNPDPLRTLSELSGYPARSRLDPATRVHDLEAQKSSDESFPTTRWKNLKLFSRVKGKSIPTPEAGTSVRSASVDGGAGTGCRLSRPVQMPHVEGIPTFTSTLAVIGGSRLYAPADMPHSGFAEVTENGDSENGDVESVCREATNSRELRESGATNFPAARSIRSAVTECPGPGSSWSLGGNNAGAGARRR